MKNNSQLSTLNFSPQNRATILLIEDNAGLNDANAQALKLRGYTVLTAENLAEAREKLAQGSPDVILLDVMLPDGSGFDFCKEIRGKTNAYILFLTAKAAHEDMVRGMTGGGDAYITKPYHPEEMLVKVDAAIRRRDAERALNKTFTLGSLTLDLIAGTAYVDGVDLFLTKKEFSLLLLFAQNESVVLSAEYLLSQVWNQSTLFYEKTLRKHISELRYKLETGKCSHTVTAVYGKGYRFELRVENEN